MKPSILKKLIRLNEKKLKIEIYKEVIEEIIIILLFLKNDSQLYWKYLKFIINLKFKRK